MPELQTNKPKNQEQVKEPPVYKVVLINDNFTPAQLVVEVLQKHFSLSEQEAEDKMMNAHRYGHAVLITCTKDEAETRVLAALEQVGNAFPLTFAVEPA